MMPVQYPHHERVCRYKQGRALESGVGHAIVAIRVHRTTCGLFGSSSGSAWDDLRFAGGMTEFVSGCRGNGSSPHSCSGWNTSLPGPFAFVQLPTTVVTRRRRSLPPQLGLAVHAAHAFPALVVTRAARCLYEYTLRQQNTSRRPGPLPRRTTANGRNHGRQLLSLIHI